MDDFIYIRAKLGENHAQKILLEHFKKVAKPIINRHIKRGNNLTGIPKEDLEELFNEAFETIIFSDELCYRTDDFFKFIFLQRIKDYFRKRIRREELYEKFLLETGLNPAEPLNDIEIYKQVYQNGHEIIDILIRDERTKLNTWEKDIIYLFSKSYSVDEISKNLNMPYSYAFRMLRTAQNKCKKYITKYMPELVF